MNLKTRIYFYRFDISKPDAKEWYEALSKKLSATNGELFDSISAEGYDFYTKKIQPLHGKVIELETKFLFNNQWNTAPTRTSASGLRVFDWGETILWERKHIKIGMYLDITDEMREIRRNTLKCNYCGAQYCAPQGQVFCDKCLDSEYLEEEDLKLLLLTPIDTKPTFRELTEAELLYLKPLYIAAQTTGTTSRAVQKRQKQRARIIENRDETIEAANAEYDGLIWLLNHNVNIDNVIYYSHTKKFCFGWQSPLSESVKSALLDVLVEFPFPYEFKSKER